MDSNAKGNVAEQAILLEPAGEHYRWDLAFDLGERILRVQCKWGRLSPRRDVVDVPLGASRCTPSGYVRTTYAADEVDLFGVYCGEINRCFLIPGALGVGRSGISLRLTPPRNNQRSCINLADSFDFEGAIAQLGERRHGMAEVTGSSPVSSTPAGTEDRVLVVNSHELRERFGYWMDRAAEGQDIVITRHGRGRVRMVAEHPHLGTPPTLTPASLEPPHTPHTAP
jgi:hypothetical protein